MSGGAQAPRHDPATGRTLAGEPTTAADGPWLLVGLGNPGPQYARHRHNVGAMVAEELTRRVGGTLRTHRAGARVCQARLGAPSGALGPAVVIAVPSTFMNTSGPPVAALARFFGVPPARLTLIHDDLDLPFGVVRLKRGGGEGGHNGLRSVSRALGTRDYLRVRVGIGRPPGRMDPADFVLHPFDGAQQAELGWVIDRAADAVEALVTEGLDKAQLRFHSPA